jgi:hypothetical protein
VNATAQDLRRIGLSAQRVNYWSDRGYLLTYRAKPGTGYGREWPPCEVLVAAYMLLLVEAGLTAGAAARAARSHGELAPGVRVLLDLPAESWATAATVYNELVSAVGPPVVSA